MKLIKKELQPVFQLVKSARLLVSRAGVSLFFLPPSSVVASQALQSYVIYYTPPLLGLQSEIVQSLYNRVSFGTFNDLMIKEISIAINNMIATKQLSIILAFLAL